MTAWSYVRIETMEQVPLLASTEPNEASLLVSISEKKEPKLEKVVI